MQEGGKQVLSDKRVNRQRGGAVLARWLLVVIIAINVIGWSGLWLYETITPARAASNDLQARVESVTKSLSPTDILSAEKLSAYSADLTAAAQDLDKLDSLLPFQGALGPISSIHHALAMAQDLIAAGQQGIAIADALRPEIQALIQSVSKPPTGTGSSGTPAITTQTLSLVNQHLLQAQTAWNLAMSERQSVSAGDLKLVPVKNIDKYLAKLDSLAPMINGAFSTVSSVLAGMPTLLGLNKTANFLLFDMDSDELRATGGYLGNFALLTLSNGLLTSGIHLHDIYTIDCPSGLADPETCPVRPNPPGYAWFGTDTFADGNTHFGLRDSNLNPDLPTSAKLIEQMYRADGGPALDGIILLTPNFITDLLKTIGPIQVPAFHETITAVNLRDKLHYYHQNPQIGEQLGISASALGTSRFKVFDVLLGQAFTQKLASLTTAQLLGLAPSIQQALHQKDLQVFSTDATIESLLEQATIAGQVRTAPDSLFVVDTNDGASYANADVTESIADTVTLDAGLGATHSLSITYDFPDVSHTYHAVDYYSDFVRVILPEAAQHAMIGGNCTPASVTETGHVELGCQMFLPLGGHVVLHASWYTPPNSPKASHSNGQSSYQLLIQRQAGSQVQMLVSIVPPSGRAIEAVHPGTVVKGNLAWSVNPLLTDTTLAATLS